MLASLLVFAGFLWLAWPSREPEQVVTLTRGTNVSLSGSNLVAFCVSNGGPAAILLTDLAVELRKGSAWQALGHTVPTHPQRLAPGETKDLTAGAPANMVPWRLRAVYGTDRKGPLLWVARAEYSITHLKLTGPGFGVMAGNFSCLSGEIGESGFYGRPGGDQGRSSSPR